MNCPAGALMLSGKCYCGDDQVIINGTCQHCPPGTLKSTDTCTNYCGNGVIDTIPGKINEKCDDGNTISGDGCSSTCMI